MATGARGLGVSQQDLDASRLVFVSVKDAKPKRKVAVPVPEGGTWDQFCRQVEAKLKLSSLDSIYLASSGERITRLDQLQDIDELYAVEGARSSNSGQGNGYGQQQQQQHRVGVADNEITAAQGSHLAADVDGDAKYARRQSSLQRTMKRWFPAMGGAGAGGANGLPLTTKDLAAPSPVEAVRRRVRRRRRRCADPRNLLVLFALASCMATAFFVWSRMANTLP